jgi:hypothetical protein
VTALTALQTRSKGWVSLVGQAKADSGPIVAVAKNVKFAAVLHSLAAGPN